jgi:hypothetical protein
VANSAALGRIPIRAEVLEDLRRGHGFLLWMELDIEFLGDILARPYEQHFRPLIIQEAGWVHRNKPTAPKASLQGLGEAGLTLLAQPDAREVRAALDS